MVNRDTAGAFGARSSADGSAADSRTQAAVQPDRSEDYTTLSDLNAKTAELVSHVWSIETRPARSALEAALMEARLIRELKPPYNRIDRKTTRRFPISTRRPLNS